MLLILATLPLWGGNSIFSYDGHPIRYYGTDIYSLGMGEAGASDVFRLNTGYANPAMHNLSNRSLFSTGIVMGYNAYRSRDGEGNEEDHLDDSLDFPYFNLSIPLKIHRVGAQFSSMASGVVSNQREFILADSTSILEKQSIDRYLYRLDLIYSISLGRNNFGISGNYYLGHEVRNFTQEADYGIFNTREKLERSYKNPGFTLGYLHHQDKFAFGAHYSPAWKLTGEEIRTSIHEEEDPVDYEYELPAQYSASVTALPLEAFKIACDLHYEDWEAIDPARYVDSWKVSLGAAYEPTGDKDNIFLRLPLRGGVSYRRLPFRADPEALETVDELALSLGLTIPLKGEVNRIDCGLQYVRRGDLDKNKLADNSFLLMFGFTGFDILNKAPDRTAPREIPEEEDIQEW
ncbi:MAG: hypothetical protein ACP5F3_02455 [Candidatus Syntrophosphaera sp.]